jgi:hypothetical protein
VWTSGDCASYPSLMAALDGVLPILEGAGLVRPVDGLPGAIMASALLLVLAFGILARGHARSDAPSVAAKDPDTCDAIALPTHKRHRPNLTIATDSYLRALRKTPEFRAKQNEAFVEMDTNFGTHARARARAHTQCIYV